MVKGIYGTTHIIGMKDWEVFLCFIVPAAFMGIAVLHKEGKLCVCEINHAL
jgi:hypothetical protein